MLAQNWRPRRRAGDDEYNWALILYAISDRRRAPDGAVEKWATGCLRAGVDWVQIREKELFGRELLALAAGTRAQNPQGQILINERADVAVAAGLDGVHLPSDSMGASACRSLLPQGAVVGVSCHSVEEVVTAEQEGADFVVFGPVFDTPSKRGYGAPAGLPVLADVCRRTRIPVLALGGVSLDNATQCRDAGAAGIAGISIFRGAPGLERAVARLRRL
jgi:thiamine-phosphate pyrophosphorylase